MLIPVPRSAQKLAAACKNIELDTFTVGPIGRGKRTFAYCPFSMHSPVSHNVDERLPVLIV